MKKKTEVSLAKADEIDKCLYLVIMLDDVFHKKTLYCSDKSKVEYGYFQNKHFNKSFDEFYGKRFTQYFGLDYSLWKGKLVLDLAKVIPEGFTPKGELDEEKWLGVKKITTKFNESKISSIIHEKENYEAQLGHFLVSQRNNAPNLKGVTQYTQTMLEHIMTPHHLETTSGEVWEFNTAMDLYSWALMQTSDYKDD